jgi:ribosomal-protein-alanine N-acetyltransferase
MAIERQVYPRPWSPNLFLSEMSELRHRAYFVAREGRDVVGYGGLMMVHADEGHITNIAVDPVHHRRRVGTRMLYELMSEAIRMGARAVSLEVRVSNEPAQSLYRKFGFHYVGTRKGYYQETNEDAYVMWVDDVRLPEYRQLLERIIEQGP